MYVYIYIIMWDRIWRSFRSWGIGMFEKGFVMRGGVRIVGWFFLLVYCVCSGIFFFGCFCVWFL